MGAAFLVALRGHQVIEVDHRAITMGQGRRRGCVPFEVSLI
jgi:hypothetical protein